MSREHNEQSDLKFVYTAMHGVGTPYARRSFEAFGFKPFIEVPEQVEPDPDFPTVAFPNPEEGKGALVSFCFATPMYFWAGFGGSMTDFKSLSYNRPSQSGLQMHTARG